MYLLSKKDAMICLMSVSVSLINSPKINKTLPIKVFISLKKNIKTSNNSSLMLLKSKFLLLQSKNIFNILPNKSEKHIIFKNSQLLSHSLSIKDIKKTLKISSRKILVILSQEKEFLLHQKYKSYLLKEIRKNWRIH